MTPPPTASKDPNQPSALAASTSEAPHDSPRWLAVYVIVKHPGRAPYWLSVGKAFVNADGSLNVRLDANPIDGKLHIRRPPERPVSGPSAAIAPPASTPTTPQPSVAATRAAGSSRGSR